MIETLHRNISKYISSSQMDITNFCELFVPKLIRKKEYILRRGEICRFEAFVTKGLFKVYHIDGKGTEQILYFGMEDWWLTDIDSFTNQTPSQLYIEALEDSEILFISKIDKDFAYNNYPFVERLFRIMTQKTHTSLQRRMIENLSRTAEQRYVDFLEKYPMLALRITNLHIAAYLGVSHEFISKIRRKIASKK